MTTPAPWQAHHIFYTAQSRPVLTECVGPLVRSLRERGLIHRYFFINYWLEGPHVRLRFQPTNTAVAQLVQDETEAAITAFLARRPALYSVQADFFVDLQNTLLDLEFTPQEKQQYLDSKGGMRQRDNNTFSRELYEPEYLKYGGPVGVDLAEWHFEVSSDLVIEADSSMNVHLRSVQLGLAGQLMLVMASAFLQDTDRIRDYLIGYHHFWKRGFEATSLIRDMEYERAGKGTGQSILDRFEVIDAARRDGDPDRLPPMLAGWLKHCLKLRARVVELAAAGQLIFPAWDDEPEAPADPDGAIEALLPPYMHMTNNRLQVTLGDEAYLAFVLSESLSASEKSA